MRGAEGHARRGRSPRGASTSAPDEADGAAAGYGRGRITWFNVVHARMMARQDVGGVGSMIRRGGMGRSQRQAAQQQTRQAQGEEPASKVKGSTCHHRADLTRSGTRKPVLIVTVVAGFTFCSPQSG